MATGQTNTAATSTSSALVKPSLVEVSSEGVERLLEDAYVAEIRLPRDEILADHGQNDPTFYEKLRRDHQVHSTFSRRRLSVIAREWKVEPGGERPIDIEAADHLQAQLDAMSWDRITYRMLGGLWSGYGVGECMFRLTDNAGRFASGWDKLVELHTIKVRRSGRFRFTNGGELRLLHSKAPTGETMPERKFWIFTCGADDDDEPYGLGLGHYCYWPIWLKRQATKFWAVFLERFSLPLPHASVPSTTSSDERDELKGALDAFVAGGRLVTDERVKLNLIQAAKDSGGDFERFIVLWDAAISKIILTQTMTTDDAATRAGGEVHMKGETVVVKSDADLINESFIAGPAAWVTEWNFPGAKTPKVYRVFDEEEDLAARATRDKTLLELGFRLTEEAFAEVYGEGYAYSPPAAAPTPEGDMVTAPTIDAPAPAPTSSTTAKIELTGTDLATIYTVNEARGAAGRLKLPNSDVDDPDGFLTVAEFRAKRAAKGEQLGEAIGAAQGANFSEGDLGDVSGALEQLLADDGWRRMLGPEVEAIEELANESTSLEEMRDRLGELMKRNPAELAGRLARAMFVGRIAGEEDADVTRE